MKYRMFICILSFFINIKSDIVKDAIGTLATIENYTTINFIGTMTIQKKPYSKVAEAVDNFMMEDKLYNSVGDGDRKLIKKFQVSGIEISSPDIDLMQFPTNLIIKYGYVKEMNDNRIEWLFESDVISANQLKQGSFTMEQNSDGLNQFNEKLFNDIKVTKKEIADTTDGIDIELDRIYFVCRVVSVNSDIWDNIDHFDILCHLIVKLESDIKLVGGDSE